MMNISKWGDGNVEPIVLPIETFGWCVSKRRPTTETTWLANGLCQRCWDKTVDKAGNNRSLLPTVDLSFLLSPSTKAEVDKFQEKP